MEIVDPLNYNAEDPQLAEKRTKKEIQNIIKSYVGMFDVFSEGIQNALDSIERRSKIEEEKGCTDWQGKLGLVVNLDTNCITISDNGTGFEHEEFIRFIAPNISYHKGSDLATRGNKGVGATYLAFGFDTFEVATKSETFSYSGRLIQGRSWVEDHSQQYERPKLIPNPDAAFNFADQGTTISITVGGQHSRPKSLGFFQAKTAEQWEHLLRCKTPIGDLIVRATRISCSLKVTSEAVTTEREILPSYPYPHEFMDAALDIEDFVLWQTQTLRKGGDVTNIPAKYSKRSGIYKKFTEEELTTLFGEEENYELISRHKMWAYASFMHSTDVWDVINDKKMGLRKGYRILRGGLLIANNGMTQGEYITIPLTSNIGYQKQCHIVIHLTNADPDLGRKGFQPEIRGVCEELAKKLVNELKRHKARLRPNTAAVASDTRRRDLYQWIREQEKYQEDHPLKLSSAHFFKPKNEISILSIPQKEQDVIALFNQLIAGGVIRSIELLATNQTMQYDGVFKLRLSGDGDLFLYDEVSNPLGVIAENLENFTSEPRILEYKHDLDYLISEFHNEEKNSNDIDLAVCWTVGSTWKEDFTCIPFLTKENISLRKFHGITHQLTSSSNSKMDVIALRDLILYLDNPAEAERQQSVYEEEQ